jgi:hypothetical protein
MKISTKLVYFIQHEERINNLGFHHGLQDASRSAQYRCVGDRESRLRHGRRPKTCGQIYGSSLMRSIDPEMSSLCREVHKAEDR